MFTVEVRDMKIETKTETMYPAQPNQRKATDAWASRQRFCGSLEPLVISLLRTYD